MKKLFLHIGSHKTGSTSIQAACTLNKKVLHQQGFYFFDKTPAGNVIESGNTSSWIPSDKSVHENIYNGIGLFVNQIEKLANKLNESHYNNVIMSAENFSWIFNAKHLKDLSNELSKFFDVRVISYIRRQDKLLMSHFQQASKSPNLPAYAYYKGGCLSLPYSREHYDEYLDYNRKLSMWGEAFGIECMIVKVFDRNNLKNEDVVIDFFSTVGINTTNIETLTINESNGFQRTKIGHLINNSSLRGGLDSVIRKCTDNQSKMLPSRQEAQAIYKKFKSSNIELNKKFNVSNEFEDIFGDDFSSYPVESSEHWDEDSANEALTNIFNALPNLDSIVDLLRDAAVDLETVDLNKSYQLMKKANEFRPYGMFIKNKLEDYERILNHEVKRKKTKYSLLKKWMRRLQFWS